MKKQTEVLLKSVYSTLNHPASFTSADKIQRVLQKQYNVILPTSEIQKWLNDQRGYILHRRALHTFKRNPTVVANLDDQWQADLLFLNQLGGPVNVCLICIDIASRFVWVQPTTSKRGKEIAVAMRGILERSSPRKPLKLQTDNGTEFFNTHFQNLMKEYKIIHFSNRSDLTKAAVVERVIRTIKEKIYRALDNDPNLTNDWSLIIQPIVDSYNNTFHSAIQLAPAEVNSRTMGNVLSTLYRKYWLEDRKWREPKFVENDYVRVSTARSPLQKGYKGKWQEEIFKIYQVKYALPNNVYKLKDLKGEKLLGVFYAQELQKANYVPEEHEFQIEEILKERVRKGVKEVFVRWAGYSDDFNEWVRESDVVDV